MTDKQIIIDGVDVSGCKKYEHEIVRCNATLKNMCFCGGRCTDEKNANCYFKQLKRKEEECEGLDGELNDLTRDIKTRLKVEKIKRDQLKAENEKLEQTIAEIKEICNEYKKEYILNIGVEILTNKILQII